MNNMDNEAKTNYELKKQEREKAKEKKRLESKTNKSSKWLLKSVLWLVIIGLIFYVIYLLAVNSSPEGEDFSVKYDIQGRDHIDIGTEHPPYNSNPPSSGWHYSSPARTGFYEESLPDETIVHNLEHGEIWIAYHPDISDEAKEALEDFAGRYVIVSPREENEGDISLVAWGRVDTFDIENGVIDETRINDFIKRYDNKGPEKVRNMQP